MSSDIYQMQIWFRGVCTHFHHNVLPGVQHRVVLPDATPLRFGLITQPSEGSDPTTNAYVLMPHVPHISVAAPFTMDFEIPNIMTKDGYLYTKSRFEILNIIETTVTYPSNPPINPPSNPPDPFGSFMDTVLPIASFVPHFDYSGEVALGGRASAYFDLSGGMITTYTETEGAVRVVVTITTDGPPQLQVTPFSTMAEPLPRAVLTLPGDPIPSSTSLLVGNVGPFCEDGIYDYLLHFLTGTGGIPTSVSKVLPGLDEARDCIPPAEAVQKLVDSGFPRSLPIIEFVELMASCSDSRYP
jgi:hypothetical protein